jgi:hypothetical protein
MRGAAPLTALLLLTAAPATAADTFADPAGWAAGIAADAAEAIDAARIRHLIGKLGSRDYRQREAAGKDLARLADKALPLMRQALRTVEDPEAGRRLEVLVGKLATERLLSPKRVTLKADRASVKELFAAVSRQTGYKFNLASMGSQQEKVRLSVDWKDRPFWQALDDVCNPTGLSVNPDGDDDGLLTVYDNDSYNPHVWYAGPFRFVATNIGSGRNVQLAGLPRRVAPQRPPEYLNLNFQIQAEPKNPIVSYHPPVLTRAVDDAGASLLPPKDDENVRQYWSPYLYRGFNQYAGVNLTRAGRDAALVKELRGKVTLVLLADTRPEITVENVLAAKKKKVVGRSAELEVESAVEGNGSVAVTLSVKQLNPNPDDYTWANTVYQRLELWDDAGVKWVGNVTNNLTNTPAAVSMTVSYSPPAGNKKVGKPSRLQLVEWVTHPREVEFVFKDIPLP